MRLLLSLVLSSSLSLLPAAEVTVNTLLVNRVDDAKKAIGIIVATLGPGGHSITAHGSLAKDRPQPPDANTVYEIGSITKVFTSLILADMVERGEVTLDTPVQKLIPASVKIPSRNGKQITLLDLSMQVSGLPRMPDNFHPADPGNPYADYGVEQLYQFLSAYTFIRDIGEKYEYSNLGVGLLGHALALKAGMTYEALLRARVLGPLGMKDTTITFSEDQKKRLATGHNAALEPVKNWDLDSIAGAGAIRSTANDMLTFLAANLELTDTPLKAAMRRMRAQRRPTGMPGVDILMAWHTFTRDGSEIVWHNGGTGGYHSFAGFDPAKKTAVVVLTNTSFDIDDIGRHILDPESPVALLTPPKQRTEIATDAKVLATYTGEYVFAPTFSVRVTAEGQHLYAQATAQPRFEIFAEKQDEFFLKVVDAQISFIRDATGQVTHLVLHQNDRDQKAPKKPSK